jgi:hypothetical protein
MEPADDFVTHTRAAGAKSMIELPLIGYVSEAMNAGPKHCGFSVAKYGAQQAVNPADPDCGNGIFPDGGTMAADPLDTSIPANEQWNKEWVQHLVATFGTAANGGVRFYNLGNQPALWHETHNDVHPARTSYAEIKAKLEANGKAVKDADPTALTMGPAAWGWMEYFDSAAADRATTGVDFIPFYLRTAQAFEAATHQRILDYLDVHVYPQATGVVHGDLTPAANAMRLRSTRILWDPNYMAESWETCCYGGVIKAVPRMRDWIAANYPGTRLSISAYSFGALDSPNGALAEVDVLGILGREGVDLATLDEPPKPDSIGEDAFKLFRNYDGQGSKFGDTSVRAISSADAVLTAFAAFDAAGHVTVVLINKDPLITDTANITFTGVGATGPFRAFQFGAGGRLASVGTGTVTGGVLTRTVQPYTATLIEFTPADGIGPAGIDEPVVDAGTPPGADAGTNDPPVAKGCSSAPLAATFVLFALIPLLTVTRRRHAVASLRS